MYNYVLLTGTIYKCIMTVKYNKPMIKEPQKYLILCYVLCSLFDIVVI